MPLLLRTLWCVSSPSCGASQRPHENQPLSGRTSQSATRLLSHSRFSILGSDPFITREGSTHHILIQALGEGVTLNEGFEAKLVGAVDELLDVAPAESHAIPPTNSKS